jgi:hypothetical protein
MSLGEGHVIHYNGVLEAADRVEGRYFKTDERQRDHSSKRSAANQVSASLQEDEGTWVLTKP